MEDGIRPNLPFVLDMETDITGISQEGVKRCIAHLKKISWGKQPGLQAGLREGSGNGFGCHCGWRVGKVRFELLSENKGMSPLSFLQMCVKREMERDGA